MMSHRSRRRQSTTSPSPDWSKLPSHLIQPIADCLKPNSGDLERFRFVCKNWRTATLPPLNLYPVLPTNSYPDYHNSFSSTAVYVFRQRRRSSSSTARNTWLATIEQSSDGTLYLLHPLTRTRIQNLPPDVLSKYLSNVDSTQELSRSFDMKYDYRNSHYFRAAINKNLPYKVILWPNPEVGCPGPRDDYVVLQEHPEESFEDINLRCYSTTHGHWYRPYSILKTFDDIVHWKELIYAVDQWGKLYGIEYKTKRFVTVVVATNLSSNKRQKKKLLLWDDKLYLVKLGKRKGKGTIKAYELDEDGHEWEELATLGNRILFVTHYGCFFVAARDLPGCPENCVVVIPEFEGETSDSNVPRGASKLFKGAGGYVMVRVFKYGEGEIELCSGFADALWPPPPWITEYDGNSSSVS